MSPAHDCKREPMRNAVLAGFVFATILAGACPVSAGPDDRSREPEPRCEDFKSIGSATMDEKGVITMDVFTLPPGPIGHGRLVYGPDSPDYQDVRKHLGPTHPGERVNVRPWC